MQQALIAVVAALVGIAVGFILRNLSANTEKSLLESQKNRAEQDAASLRAELSTAQALASQRAGFESQAAERQTAIDRLTAERATLQSEIQSHIAAATQSAALISKLTTDLENEKKKVEERDEFLKKSREEFANQFEALAGKILDEKSKTFADASQKDLGNLLTPLKSQIEDFRKKVEEAQTDSKTGVAKLEGMIGSLQTATQQTVNAANDLTNALKGSAKAQGDWGEFILRDLLENAGLRQGEEYEFQQPFKSLDEEDSRRNLFPDVLIKLPGGRSLIIDSKVSLTAYTDFVNATDEDAKKSALKQHLVSVRSHVSELANSGYHKLPGIDSPDFVVMFVPIEPAFFTAIKEDERLWSDAYKLKVLLVGPSTLLFVIRMVHELWTQEVKAQNYREILDRGTKLYDKFVSFLADLDEIGSGLDNAQKSFAGARSKLTDPSTGLVRQVDRLRELGVSPKVKKKGKKATLAVIPGRWLDGTDANEEVHALAAGSADEENETQEEESGSEVSLTDE